MNSSKALFLFVLLLSVTAVSGQMEQVENHPEYYAGGDGAHLAPVGVTALARQVADVILETIKEK
jgi:hypothetical protein